MPVHRIPATLNRTLLLLFILLMTAATVIAVHEIFFALPQCPDRASDCLMRHGHWRGSKLVAAILVGAWAVAAAWWWASRELARRGRTMFLLAPLWLLPLTALASLLPILF